ncbi:hypothetical protein ARMSODRAFT_1080923 [Armillaria solidipes]|uniref:Uncharacterized protein n=1 Tax=Armillaria solidipes TaxID=1076256 RepID=A0A2H3BSW3_9AGAR|nr:hypothetical protein ARMSODRAFT_1080923 [Armillaria solidipes]
MGQGGWWHMRRLSLFSRDNFRSIKYRLLSMYRRRPGSIVAGNFLPTRNIVVWQASLGQCEDGKMIDAMMQCLMVGYSGTCSREPPTSFPLINATPSQTQAPSTTLQVPIMAYKNDEVFFAGATVLPQALKWPANMDCREWEKIVFHLVPGMLQASRYTATIVNPCSPLP